MAKLDRKGRLFKLKDIVVDYISVLHGENSSPANPGAVTLFVKNKEKEGKSMSRLMQFFSKFKKEEIPVATDAVDQDTPDNAKEDVTIDYVSKADLEKTLATFKTDVIATVKEVVLEKSTLEKDEFANVMSELGEAFKEELSGLKKSLIGEKRASDNILKQPDLKDLLKQAMSDVKEVPVEKKEQEKTQFVGDVVDRFIEKNIGHEEMVKRGFATKETEFDQVLDELCSM